MSITVSIANEELAKMTDAILGAIESAQPAVEEHMAKVYCDIVKSNIGDSGPAREIEWAPLVPWYAKKVGRSHATLRVTGELLASIKPVQNTVEANSSYAAAHQEGVLSKNLPRRPFFPMKANNDPTEYAQNAMQNAAADKLSEVLQ